MKYIYNYNPIDITFYQWASESPLSGHPLDDKRFFKFITTVHVYGSKSKQWRKKDYFIKKFKEYNPHCSIEEANELFDKMELILYYLESKNDHMRVKETDILSEDSGCVAYAVVKNKMKKASISKGEYDNRKVTLKHFA